MTEIDYYKIHKEDVKYITNILNHPERTLCMLIPVLSDALIYEIKPYIELTPSRKQLLSFELRQVEKQKARRPLRQHLKFCKKHKLDPSIIKEIKYQGNNKFHLFYRDYTRGLNGMRKFIIIEPGVIYEGSAPPHVARAAEALAKDYHYFL